MTGFHLARIVGALLWLAGPDAASAQNRLPSPAEDVERVAGLMKDGVKLEAPGFAAWFPREALPPDEMKSVVGRLERGLTALEAFLQLPRRWQGPGARRVDYFFVAGPFFVPHAVNRQVFVPIVRLRDGKAPLLHETTHALLMPPQGRRPLAWLTEGLAAYVAKSVSAASGIPEGDAFELGDVQALDTGCAARLASAEGRKILKFIGAPANLQDLYAMEPAFEVRQVFYGCAASFTKYLVDRAGIDAVVDALPEPDPHRTLEKAADTSMAALRATWLTKIGAAGPGGPRYRAKRLWR